MTTLLQRSVNFVASRLDRFAECAGCADQPFWLTAYAFRNEEEVRCDPAFGCRNSFVSFCSVNPAEDSSQSNIFSHDKLQGENRWDVSCGHHTKPSVPLCGSKGLSCPHSDLKQLCDDKGSGFRRKFVAGIARCVFTHEVKSIQSTLPGDHRHEAGVAIKQLRQCSKLSFDIPRLWHETALKVASNDKAAKLVCGSTKTPINCNRIAKVVKNAGGRECGEQG